MNPLIVVGAAVGGTVVGGVAVGLLILNKLGGAAEQVIKGQYR